MQVLENSLLVQNRKIVDFHNSGGGGTGLPCPPLIQVLNGLISLTKFHSNPEKIVVYVLMTKFLPNSKFLSPVFISRISNVLKLHSLTASFEVLIALQNTLVYLIIV